MRYKGRKTQYLISDKGEVKRISDKKVMSQYLINSGYKTVSILTHEGHKQVLVHRLMMMSFKPEEYKKGLQVNHKDYNKTNNSLENLEWVTVSENIRHGYLKEHKKLVPVYCYSANGEYIESYPSVSEAARNMGITQSNISSCLINLQKSAGGYQWRYEKFDEIEPIKIKRYKKAVLQIDKNTNETIKSFESAAMASRETLVQQSDITRVCQGKRKTAGGFIWAYADAQ